MCILKSHHAKKTMVRFPNALPFYYKRVAQAQQVIVDGLQHMTHLALVRCIIHLPPSVFPLGEAAHGPRHTQGHAHTRVGIKALPPACFWQEMATHFLEIDQKNTPKKESTWSLSLFKGHLKLQKKNTSKFV